MIKGFGVLSFSIYFVMNTTKTRYVDEHKLNHSRKARFLCQHKVKLEKGTVKKGDSGSPVFLRLQNNVNSYTQENVMLMGILSQIEDNDPTHYYFSPIEQVIGRNPNGANATCQWNRYELCKALGSPIEARAGREYKDLRILR